MTIKITRPRIKDLQQIHQLFEVTIKDNFRAEGILETLETEANQEIQALIRTLAADFESGGEEEYHLLARIESKVVGTIAYGKANPLITNNIDAKYHKVLEVKSVYILPQFQNKGIGSLLFQRILSRLSTIGIKDFYLDSGYKKAQSFWTKKLGEPICTLKDYWAEGSHHMIWYGRVNELIS